MSNRWLQISLLVLIFSMAIIAGTREERFQKQVEFASGGTILVENVNGRVEIEGWDKEEVYVQAIKRVKARDDDRAQEMLDKTRILVEKNGDRLEIITETPRGRGKGFWGWSGGNKSSVTVSYRIQVPVRSVLKVGNTNGEIDIIDINGNADIETTNGKIIIDKLTGEVEARTTNGSIEVDLDAFSGEDEVDLSTTNGSIRLYLPAGSGFEVRAQTTNGSVVSDFDVDERRRDRKRRSLRGATNGGGPMISMETTNGSIYLRDK